MGRPAKDGQLVIGLLLLKHMTGLSGEGVVTAVLENPYMQAFCGFEKFVTEEILDSSTLTHARKRLGLEFFKEFERKTYKPLIDRNIIKAKGMLVDATVFPENINVSFHRPYVRPIKRGKSGRATEFEAKGALSHVDGFLFLDHVEHSAFAEEK